MRDQTDRGKPGIAGNGAIDIAMFIHPGIRDAHFLHFLHKMRAKQLLLFRRRTGFGKFIGLGVKGHIFQKSFSDCFHYFSPSD